MTFEQVKTSELTGAALNWSVAICEGYKTGMKGIVEYSTIWDIGGPIIEREKLELRCNFSGEWAAQVGLDIFCFGPTPLIAAMRCYVASKLGDMVEVPEELL